MDLEQYIVQQESEKRQKYLVEFFSELSTKTYERANIYTNLIIGVGYVGFFTAWENLKTYLPAKTLNTAAFLMLLSLSFFIFYEVAKMIWTAIYLQVVIRPLQSATPETIDARIEKFNKDQNSLLFQQMVLWVFALTLTLIPAIIASWLILSEFGAYLLK